MYAYVGRITRPYVDISGMVVEWSKYMERLWVVEHPEDEKVKQTHCHLFIYNSKSTSKNLKELKIAKEFKFDGNKDWSFPAYNPVEDIMNPDVFKYVIYMTKGKFDCKFSKNDNGMWELCKSLWVEPSPRDNEVVYVTPKKKTNYDFGREVVNRYADEYPQHIADDIADVDAIIRITGEVLRANKRGRNYRNTANVAQDALADLDPTRWHNRVKSLM